MTYPPSIQASATGRQIAEMRAFLLVEVGRRAIVDGITLARAMEQFARESRLGRLDTFLAGVVAIAVERPTGTVSARTLRRWKLLRDTHGFDALVPQLTDFQRRSS